MPSSEHRWSKFWWQDWQRDPALKMCSLAARGFWMEILCIAFAGTPQGHVTIGGVKPTTKQLAAVVGISEKDALRLLKELEENRVFSRTEDGTIFSRRMIKDKEAYEVAKTYGKWGGNPSLKGKPKNGIRGRVNPQVKATDNPRDNGGVNNPLILEVEEEKESEAEGRKLPPFYDLEGVSLRPEDGRPVVNGSYLDRVWERVVEAARIDEARWRGDLRPLVAWLQANIEPDTIVAAIERVASRANYSTPFTLAFFDPAVREQRAAA